MKKFNLKRTNLKNLCSFLFSHLNSLLGLGFGNSINRQFKPVNSSITLMFVQYFSLALNIADNLTTLSPRSCRLSTRSLYIRALPCCTPLLKNNYAKPSEGRYFSSTSGGGGDLKDTKAELVDSCKALNLSTNGTLDRKSYQSSSNNKYYWKTHICGNISIITPEILKTELLNFFSMFKSNYKAKNFAFMWKIRFANGDYRSCCTVQLADINDFDGLYNVLCYIFTTDNLWLEVSEQENKDSLFVDNLPVGNIIFNYKLLKKIKGTKYEKFVISDNKLLLNREVDHRELVENSFKYKNYSIPNTMDLSVWPNIRFFSDYKLAHSILNIKITATTYYSVDYNFNILDDSYSVTVSNKGAIIFTFIDESTSNCKDLTKFKRTIIDGKNCKKTYYFDSGQIIGYFTEKNVGFITPKSKDILTNRDKIITLDLETRLVKNNQNDKKMIPICMSIYDGEKCMSFTFYKNWSLGMAEAFKSIMKRKYDGYRIYIHNFSYFDSMFMVDVLSTLGKVTPLMRDSKILKLTFNFSCGHSDKRRCNLYFYDSMLILPNSLESLSVSFNIETPKIRYPLKFLNKDSFSLNYVGAVPEYKYFYKAFTKDFTMEDYKNYCNTFKSNKWNLKKELIKYCEIDTIALHQVITKFRMKIYNLFEVDITKYPTISSLTFGIYRTVFMKEYRIPRILSKLHYIIKESYYGGITENYKGLGWNLNSYDVNSLYPFSMWSFPMPTGKPTHFVGDIFKFNKDPFGFLKVKVCAPRHLNKPFLPTRIHTEKGGLRTIFPVGSWEGWYFSEEIKNAQKYGYKFEILEGYLFEKDYIFKDYVEILYKMKAECDSSDPLYYIAKLLMNGLYGRFGLNPEAKIVKIATADESEDIIKSEENVDVIPLPSGNVMISFMKDLDELEKWNISVPISAAIAAYSRIHMSQFMIKYENFIYSIDTDGIKLDTKLDDQEINNKKLGKMKHEYSLLEGAFPAPKVYGGILTKKYKQYDREIVKCRGLKSTIPYFILKYIVNKNISVLVYQEKWIRALSESTIIIKNSPFTLALTGDKRELVFDSLGNFIDSVPFTLENGKLIRIKTPTLYYLPLYVKLYLPLAKNFLCLPSPNRLLYLPSPAKLLCLPPVKKMLLLPLYDSVIYLEKTLDHIIYVEPSLPDIIYLAPPKRDIAKQFTRSQP